MVSYLGNDGELALIVIMTVCGPHALSDSVRSVLASEIAGPSAILKGRPSVTLHVEKFGTAVSIIPSLFGVIYCNANFDQFI